MTDMANVDGQLVSSDVFQGPKVAPFQIDEAYWGYIIRAANASSVFMYVAQTITMFLGAAFMAAALGLLLMPATVMDGQLDLFRIFAVIMFVAASVFLLWFASRGTETELQIDTTLGEVREVVRNRTGKTTLLGRYGFDAIGGVFINRQPGQKLDALMLRYRNTSQTLLIATAKEADLQPLRDRLGRDLMIVGADKG
ncbi:hypothetical protein [Yoonia sp. 208BN28-4]|uniref:hypothetical protein n=1 Tax=Yoonia sp. 208BN28-4 TaxID=3126505 RepID=UPI0030AF371E